MAVKSRKSTRGKPRGKNKKASRSFRPLAFVRRWLWRTGLALALLAVCVVLLFRVVNPPTTHTIWSESRRLDGVQRTWVDAANIAPVMLRSAVAAEDANFCTHWGFDMDAIRAAIDDGASRGGSTISQQVVKNVYLWQARSYVRKALEALMTPLLEALWPKRRILEVYLNVAEFDEGVFGVDAAARHYFGVSAGALTDRQAALLASVLPNPKEREANRPSAAMNRRAATIMDGAALIAKDGRAACFEN
ncbi:monofunctional biosynthetic peptidoglycan transglycosylase [Antarctobacter heliothermus]|uniref:Biosynthetic peptidoglycan transglycosylase n=1 Tax=Antarctobacter heliothermus TaxID=74033 RepID=A0A222DY67_9RHOB|nr:monofunctional biosynthetic peptidoglycan transglycosylase [Antarctobacter heliothermus]ASP18914.1 monofunctional biosynthetic peptidoglycan transglycosylase [Antarctobacter heliothermus]